ncbi:MAG TPA: gamma carbonic anhydrase family protein [Methanolinea sp.]|jgi:carbonic anhydrase/acetyltransferase-like protein (isoleucine patch superfamily)|nr:MAG: Carbonic anhydrase precursor [Methanoregulaceae archaeon PtaB.Bin009]OPY40517.1 MAG: Carbonic anhydrase precursor [Methanoregulaceae archaeon PtaU1.Bin066]HII76126.1 gamma carbonic anhydrase family protein [Methanolinea sp.]HNQ28747.1 gamma carbonic anhydrase family protein [Methanolinea sp.]
MAVGRTRTAETFVAENATVLGDVKLGLGVSIWFGAVVRGDRDKIVISDRSNVQDNAVIHTSKGFPARIGEDVSIGHGAILHGCTISDRVLVGMGAIVLNGAVVGEDCLIGAGSVVTEGTTIAPGSVVVGVPGKVIKQVTEAQRQHILQNARNYWEMAGSYLHV